MNPLAALSSSVTSAGTILLQRGYHIIQTRAKNQVSVLEDTEQFLLPFYNVVDLQV